MADTGAHGLGSHGSFPFLGGWSTLLVVKNLPQGWVSRLIP